jgi:uncharacterized damage-inducible protein DinB
MKLTDLLLSELGLEAEYTRKHLERVEMEHADFKPQDRSMTLGWLASFIAVMPTWGTSVLMGDSYDVAPDGKPVEDAKLATSRQELLETFDRNIADVRTALQSMRDESLLEPWSLQAAGNTVFTEQRYLVFRTFFVNHMVHHRAQLGVYLRLTGAAVPAVYNDSADEKGGMFMESPGEVPAHA